LLQFVLLPDWVFLAFQRPFFFPAIGLWIFLFLSAVAVFSAKLFLVLYLWFPHHDNHFHLSVVQ
jgi:hypothetical protein